jgi:hypothetical protein
MMKEFVMVHIPRSAGTSMRRLLGLYKTGGGGKPHISCHSHKIYDFRGELGDHPTAAQLRKKLGNVWTTSVSFAFVRNPWDRRVSEWSERKRYKKFLHGEEHVDANIVRRGFNHWVHYWYNRQHEKTNHYYIGTYPLDNWSFIAEDDIIIVDFVGFYERLHTDFSALCRFLGIDHVALPSLKEAIKDPDAKRKWHISMNRIEGGEKIPYQDFYNKDSIQMVAEMDAKEIEYFGYDFEQVII